MSRDSTRTAVNRDSIPLLFEEGVKREHGLRYSNIYVTIPPLTGLRVAEYLDPSGRSPFHIRKFTIRWASGADPVQFQSTGLTERLSVDRESARSGTPTPGFTIADGRTSAHYEDDWVVHKEGRQ